MRWIFALFCVLTVHAWGETPVVRVTSVQGAVLLVHEGQVSRVLQDLEGLVINQRLRLPSGGRISLLYPANGRLENWQGEGTVVITQTEGKTSDSSLKLTSSVVPGNVARQIFRLPEMLAAENLPMRTRAFEPQDRLSQLESSYRQLRASAPVQDVEPELFLLSGLFELREFDRLERSLADIRQRYPDEGAVKMVARLYQRSINNARQSGK